MSLIAQLAPSTKEQIVSWVRQYAPEYTDEECIDAWFIYRSYRDEGQSAIVSRQYAGLI